MKISRILRRVIDGDKVVANRRSAVRSVIAWVFIALVALFLTHGGERPSLYDKPLPMPPGVETSQGLAR